MARVDTLIATAIEADADAIIDRDFRFTSGPRNVFVGHFRPPGGGIPEEAIFVDQSGGAGPGRYFSGTPNINRINVQVLYRGRRKKVDEARATADQIREALEKVVITDIIYVHALESAPMAAGLNSNERSVFSFNLEVAQQGVK